MTIKLWFYLQNSWNHLLSRIVKKNTYYVKFLSELIEFRNCFSCIVFIPFRDKFGDTRNSSICCQIRSKPFWKVVNVYWNDLALKCEMARIPYYKHQPHLGIEKKFYARASAQALQIENLLIAFDRCHWIFKACLYHPLRF